MTPRQDDTTPSGNAISPTEKVTKAAERKAFSALYRVAIYAIGAVAVGGAGIGANAHTRISDEHDQRLLNTQAIKVLEDDLRLESTARKEHDEKVDEKLDEMLRILYNRPSSESVK